MRRIESLVEKPGAEASAEAHATIARTKPPRRIKGLIGPPPGRSKRADARSRRRSRRQMVARLSEHEADVAGGELHFRALGQARPQDRHQLPDRSFFLRAGGLGKQQIAGGRPLDRKSVV